MTSSRSLQYSEEVSLEGSVSLFGDWPRDFEALGGDGVYESDVSGLKIGPPRDFLS